MSYGGGGVLSAIFRVVLTAGGIGSAYQLGRLAERPAAGKQCTQKVLNKMLVEPWPGGGWAKFGWDKWRWIWVSFLILSVIVTLFFPPGGESIMQMVRGY